jgi:hypothetical protein
VFDPAIACSVCPVDGIELNLGIDENTVRMTHGLWGDSERNSIIPISKRLDLHLEAISELELVHLAAVLNCVIEIINEGTGGLDIPLADRVKKIIQTINGGLSVLFRQMLFWFRKQHREF